MLYLDILREFVEIQKALEDRENYFVVYAMTVSIHIERLKSFISLTNILMAESLIRINASMLKVV